MSIFEIFARLTGRELAKNKTKSTVRRAVIGPRWEKKKSKAESSEGQFPYSLLFMGTILVLNSLQSARKL